MHHQPRRRALAGSVLVLGSVSAVTAVHLDPAPAGPDALSAAATAPPAAPGVRPSMPQPDGRAGTDGQTGTDGQAGIDGHWAVGPVRSAPARRNNPSATRHPIRTADRPVTGRDLIDIARGPRGGGVVVPVHDTERTVPLRSIPRSGRHDAYGGLLSLDDILDLDQVGARHRAPAFDDADFDRADFDRADTGWDRAGRSGVGYRQADVTWDSSDVSYSRPRCGRHRA